MMRTFFAARLLPTLLLLLALLPAGSARAQELLAEVRVSTENVTISDPSIIQQMQNDIRNLLNTQPWTNLTYGRDEKIRLKMFIGITAVPQNGTYNTTMRLISSRPVYGTSYETNMVSLVDKSFNFNYSPQNPLSFSANSFTSNLASLLGFYANLVIGLDRDSFGRLGGTPYYEQARTIVNYTANQTQSSEPDEGWRGSGSRERHFVLDNLLDPQLEAFRTSLYAYYRQGMDVFIEKPADARASILAALTSIQKTNVARPGTLFVRAFFDAKADEITNIFRTGTDEQKQQLVTMLTDTDPDNLAKYQTLLNR